MTKTQYVLPPLALPEAEGDKKTEHLFRQLISDSNSILVLSPHLDDAVLSMGSQLSYLSDCKKNVSVLSFFTEGSNVATEYNTRLVAKGGFSTAEEYFVARRIEDKKALSFLGNAQVKHIGLVDAGWRISLAGKIMYSNNTIGVPRNAEDAELHNDLIKYFKTLTQNYDLIFAPLGCGAHVDHVLVRDAAAAVFSKTIYYTDFPYSEKHALDISYIKQQKLIDVLWRGDYKKKIVAIHAYETQLQILFGIGGICLPLEKFWLSKSLLV